MSAARKTKERRRRVTWSMEVMGILTISDIAVVELLQDLRPDIGVAVLVGCDCGWFEMDNLCDSAGHDFSTEQ